MNILITGAFGFVGRNLSDWLAGHGHKVVALDIARQELKTYGEFYSWDELEEIPWGEVDAVVHLAGKAHDTRNTSDPQSYFDVNVGLTKRIVSALVHYCDSALVGGRKTEGGGQRTEDRGQRTEGGGSGLGQDRHCETRPKADGTLSPEALPQWNPETSGPAAMEPLNQAEGRLNLFEPGRRPIEPERPTHERRDSQTKARRKFILFSSVKAVADQVEGVLTEEAVPAPKTPYGQSKLDAEREVLKCGSSEVREFGTANGTNQANEGDSRTLELENFRTYILRPCMIHGPGNKGNLNALYGVVRKGIPWPLGGFENRRSFASIGNVCAVVEGLLKGDVPSGTYQVADDEALATNELISVMAETMGRHARIWKIPRGFVKALARTGDVLRLPLNSERLKKLTESYVVSNAKIKQALGWDKMPVAARDGMRTTVESFSRQGAKTPR